MDDIKKNLKIELGAQYSNIVNFVNKIPMHEKIKEHCFQNLDQGLMWCEKGIDNLVLEQKQPLPEENKDIPQKEPELLEKQNNS